MSELLIPKEGYTAHLSTCGTYRYTLGRVKSGVAAIRRPGVSWIMLNPSTADAAQDDPTLRRVMAFSWAWGFSSLVVVNLYALRSPQPEALWTHPDPVGPVNDECIQATLSRSERVICAWGAHARPDRVARARELIAKAEVPAFHLGLTKGGKPRHPLYIPGGTELLPWPPQPATTAKHEA
ncbi:DUF1643 domain-containing protein [Rhodovarius crocodyli]|uniref:DUF1643 domain-containing protein n=1 Tax=Rhodovarius crocodyli TaxID=1979269 RepID=A0A437M100_9PROT|nr:DUF1643 domain-containing protein [Rhodovarius crocodyli]RVT91367.1 DUF1643 domain-containing protein [Rhodovarius crocodyli]